MVFTASFYEIQRFKSIFGYQSWQSFRQCQIKTLQVTVNQTNFTVPLCVVRCTYILSQVSTAARVTQCGKHRMVVSSPTTPLSQNLWSARMLAHRQQPFLKNAHIPLKLEGSLLDFTRIRCCLTRIHCICVPFHLATTAQLRAGELAENDVAPRSDKRQLPDLESV